MSVAEHTWSIICVFLSIYGLVWYVNEAVVKLIYYIVLSLVFVGSVFTKSAH